jgi:hypothetical protein
LVLLLLVVVVVIIIIILVVVIVIVESQRLAALHGPPDEIKQWKSDAKIKRVVPRHEEEEEEGRVCACVDYEKNSISHQYS